MHNLHRTLAAVRKRSRAVVEQQHLDQQQQQQQQQQDTYDAPPCEQEGMTTAEMRRAVSERCGAASGGCTVTW